MRVRSLIALVCILMVLSVGIGTAYASYTSTLTDDEDLTVNNNYGTVTMSESEGVYTMYYVADRLSPSVDIRKPPSRPPNCNGMKKSMLAKRVVKA